MKEARESVFAATTVDLKELVEKKHFDKDLFDRLSVATLSLPPLRDLGNDILKIALHYVQVYNAEFKKRVQGFTESAEKALLSHSWPGNVRELANCIERAMIFVEREKIDSEDLIISSS